jgi:methionyl-tRNA formyltransferase
MKIIFLGEDSFSAAVLDKLIFAGHEILKVYTPFYNNNIYKRLEVICAKNIIAFDRINNINSKPIQDEIFALSPEIIIVTHFEKVLKSQIISIPKFGCINLHPSLLPNYRGLAPQHWPIIKGENFTGITVHYINEGIDTGDIIIQKKIQIQTNDCVYDLQLKMKDIYGQIILEALNIIENNIVVPIVQTNLVGSYYGRLKIDDCVINLNGKAKDAYNLIRGVSFPYFGARCKDYIIWKANFATKDISDTILNIHHKDDIYLNSDYGDYIKFKDGILIIEKYTIYER